MTMPVVTLGATGLCVSALCFGTLTMAPIQADLPVPVAGALIRAAIAGGVNFIDTAQGYRAYPHVRAGICGTQRERLVIATKSTARTAKEMRAAYNEACRELGTDYIDIFHLHLIRSADDLRDRRGALDALRALRDQCRVKAIGITAHAIAPFRLAADVPDITVLMPAFNRDGLGITDGTVADMAAVLDDLHARGRGIYAMKPLGGGHHRADAPAALAFVRSHACIDAVAVGMRDRAELDMNLAWFAGAPVTPSMRSAAAGVPRRLLINHLCRRCGTCVKTCAQNALTLKDGRVAVDPAKCVFCGYCGPVCPAFAIRVI